MRQTRIVLYGLKPLQSAGDYSSLPDDIVFNQFESGSSTSGTYYGTIGGSANGHNAYSLQIPPIYLEDYGLSTSTNRPLYNTLGNMGQSNFATIYGIMYDYSHPKITKEELARLFYIYEISDYGNQSASFNNYDFSVKMFVNGYKIRQDKVGLLRCYSSKQAFVLLDRSYFGQYSMENVFIGETKGTIETTATAVITPRTFRSVLKTGITDKVALSSSSGTSVAKLEGYLSDNMPSASFTFDCDDGSTDATLRRADGILQELLRTERFDLLYKGSDGYRKLSSAYYETICASKTSIPAFTRVADSDLEDGAMVDTVNRQTFDNADGSTFDYYKYVYRAMYKGTERFGIGSDDSKGHADGVWYAALLDIFRGIDISKLFICDRSRLRDYWLASSVVYGSGKSIGSKTIGDYMASDMADLTIYGLRSGENNSSVNPRPFRYTHLIYGKDYYFDASGRIVTLNSDFSEYEIIPSFNSRFHARLARSQVITGSAASSIDVGAVLKARNMYGSDMALSASMIEAYADGRLVTPTVSDTKITLGYLDLLPDNMGSSDMASSSSIAATTSMSNLEIDYDIPVGYAGGATIGTETACTLYDESLTTQWDPNASADAIGLSVDPLAVSDTAQTDSSGRDYLLYDGSDSQVKSILMADEPYADADYSIHALDSAAGTVGQTVATADPNSKYSTLDTTIKTVTDSLATDIYGSANSKALEDSLQSARVNMSVEEVGGSSTDSTGDSASLGFGADAYPPQFVQIDIDGIDASIDKSQCVVHVFEYKTDSGNFSEKDHFVFENYGMGQLRSLSDGRKRLIYLPSLGQTGETVRVTVDLEQKTDGKISGTKTVSFSCHMKTSRSVVS